MYQTIQSAAIHQTEIKKNNPTDCGDANSYGSDYVPESMICAGAEGLDSCQVNISKKSRNISTCKNKHAMISY